MAGEHLPGAQQRARKQAMMSRSSHLTRPLRRSLRLRLSQLPPHPLPEHPANGKLRSLTTFLTTYPTQGLPAGACSPVALPLLPRADLKMLATRGYVPTTLGHALDGMLAKMRQRAAKHHLACGGGRCTLADLHQEPANLAHLASYSDARLCQTIHADLFLLARLLHTSQLARARWERLRLDEQAETTRGQRALARWRDWHQAAGTVLLRVVHACARLCERVDRWYAEQCLRHELERVWGELFGPNVPIGHEWVWLYQLTLPTWSEQRILEHLLTEPNEQRRLALFLKGKPARRETPPAFVELVAAWDRRQAARGGRAP